VTTASGANAVRSATDKSAKGVPGTPDSCPPGEAAPREKPAPGQSSWWLL